MKLTDSEHATHRAAIAAARAAKAESDAALTLVLSKRDELENAKRRLSTVEANFRPHGVNVADTSKLVDDLKRRIPDLESAVTDAEARCRVIAADRLAAHDQAIAQAAAEIAAKRAQEDQEAAALLEANRRQVASEAAERLSLRQRRMDDRRKLLASVSRLEGAA